MSVGRFDPSDLPRFTIQAVGRGMRGQHVRVYMNGHLLHGVHAAKVEKMAAGIHSVELVLLSTQVAILPDAKE